MLVFGITRLRTSSPVRTSSHGRNLVIMGIYVLVIGILTLLGLANQKAKQKADKERTEQLKSIASLMNLEFYPTDATQMMNAMSDVQLFSRGRGKRITNVMQGEVEGVSVTLFDYRYVTGRRKRSRTYELTIIFFQSPTLNLPYFSLCPEHILHKISGYQDINFNSHPGFSEHYLLRGSEEEGIREVFTDSVLDFYQMNLHRYTEGKGDRFIYYHGREDRSGNRTKPEQLQDLLTEGLRVFRLFSYSR